MEVIKWCLRKKKGLRLTEPKEHLAESYMNQALEALKNCEVTTGTWKIVTAYYACYNALYSVMQKIGVKSEIHDCTIAAMKLIPDFTQQDREFIKEMKELRIKTQYYLEKPKAVALSKVKSFVFKCKVIVENITSSKIDSIREQLCKYQSL